jgi:hypothetical protein
VSVLDDRLRDVGRVLDAEVLQHCGDLAFVHVRIEFVKHCILDLFAFAVLELISVLFDCGVDCLAKRGLEAFGTGDCFVELFDEFHVYSFKVIGLSYQGLGKLYIALLDFTEDVFKSHDVFADFVRDHVLLWIHACITLIFVPVSKLTDAVFIDTDWRQ